MKIVTLSEAKGLTANNGEPLLSPSLAQGKFRMT